jgi:hypothetical protein
MRKIVFILLLFVAFSINVPAQWTDFPAGYDAVPEIKLKGAVHTVLTVDLSGDTRVEIFDADGKRIEMLTHRADVDDDGVRIRLNLKITFTYDANGKLIKESRSFSNGQQFGYSTYIYDSTNRLSEKIDYSANGEKVSKTTYTYFPQKKQVEVDWITLKSDGKPNSSTKVSLFYNEKNQWIKRTDLDSLNEDGSTYSGDFITFEYDEKGNVINNAHCCKYRFSHRYNYEFDNQGNWIERQDTSIKFNKATGKETVEPNKTQTYRIITYYSKN